MLRVPPAFPLSLLVALLSLAVAGGSAYTLWEWYSGTLVEATYLLAGAAGLLWALGGRWGECGRVCRMSTVERGRSGTN